MIVKLVVEKSNGDLNPTKVLKARVVREGGRTVDSATFTVPINADLEQNDKVHYIQDNVDTDYLTALYNFQGNVLDESGNFLDPSSQTFDAFIYPNNSETVSSVGYDNTGSVRNRHNYCIVYHSQYTTIPHDTKLDFSKQFDVVCVVTQKLVSGSVGDKKIFVSKMDNSGNGFEIGSYCQGTTNWVGYARVRYNSIERQFISDESMGQSSSTRTLRLWRDEEHKIRFSFDDITNGSWYNGGTSLTTQELDTSDTALVPYTLHTTNDMFIGAGRNSGENWKGIAYQLRIYTGSYLTDSDFQKILLAPTTPINMRFSGIVYNTNDSTKTKTASCKGSSDKLLNANLVPANFTSSVPNDSSYVNRVTYNGVKRNVYDTGQSTNDILTSLVNYADSDFTTITDSTSTTIGGYLVAEGSLLSLMRNVLGVLDNSVFWSNGRKTLFIEKDTGSATSFTLSSNLDLDYGIVHANILEQGKSDEYMVNEVELIGRVIQKPRSHFISNVYNGYSYSLTYYPLDINIYSQGTGFGQGSMTEGVDYTVDYEGRSVNFLTSNNNVVIDYYYEDLDIGGNNRSDSYCLLDDATSVSTYGKHARRYSVPNLTVENDLYVLAQKLLSKLKDPKERYQVTLPYLECTLRENHKISVKNLRTDTKSITADVMVKQIEYQYPECITKMQVGENYIDQFDYDLVTNTNINASLSSIQRTKS